MPEDVLTPASSKRHALIERFLTSIGRPKDAEFYLQLFRQQRPESFAVLCISGSVLRSACDVIAADIRFLVEMGLTPIVVVGLVTPPRDSELTRLEQAIGAQQFCWTDNEDEVRSTAASGRVSFVRWSESVTIDQRFDRLTQLVKALEIHRVVFIGRRSGLQPAQERPRSIVTLESDFEDLSQPGILGDHQRALLLQLRKLLLASPANTTVSVTSPIDVLRELFTQKGGGTLVRRGAKVRRYAEYDQLDPKRVRALIETSFRKTLADDFLARDVQAIYLADDYRGLAVIIPSPYGSYLTKFVVERAAQGEGIGRDIWAKLASEHPQLLWRARPDNPIASWYAERCSGMATAHGWRVFWRGLELEGLAPAVQWACDRPIDLIA